MGKPVSTEYKVNSARKPFQSVPIRWLGVLVLQRLRLLFNAA